MKPIEYVKRIINGDSYNLEFKNVEIYRGSTCIASFEGRTYIRRGDYAMTVFSYAYALDDIQRHGAMLGFRSGHYDFFSSWRMNDENSIIHIDRDSIYSFIIAAIDDNNRKDIALIIAVPPFNIVFSDCYNVMFD